MSTNSKVLAASVESESAVETIEKRFRYFFYKKTSLMLSTSLGLKSRSPASNDVDWILSDCNSAGDVKLGALDSRTVARRRCSCNRAERRGRRDGARPLGEARTRRRRTEVIEIPAEIMEEILAGEDTKKGQKNEDLLLQWIKRAHIRRALQLHEKVDPALVSEVITRGYAHDLKDTELEALGRDPFIIAYAMAKPNRCVVSVETSEPGKKRLNRKVPDVCNTFDIACYQPYEINRTLGFRTDWKKP